MSSEPIPLLDHGFVRLVDTMGDDAAIVQAARVSYGEGTRARRDDRGLIRYLMRHRHTSPFEMCEIKLHIKAPIFVARQWMRHRTASINEVSGRYSVLTDDVYSPEQERMERQSATNGQGSGGPLPEMDQLWALDAIDDVRRTARSTYAGLIEAGLAREVARGVLTLNHYTEWYWKIDLHNLLHFLSLRVDRHAQYEIRVYAEAIAEIVAAWCPLAYEAWVDYRRDGMQLSRMEVEALRRALEGVDWAAHCEGDMSAREVRELVGRLA